MISRVAIFLGIVSLCAGCGHTTNSADAPTPIASGTVPTPPPAPIQTSSAAFHLGFLDDKLSVVTFDKTYSLTSDDYSPLNGNDQVNLQIENNQVDSANPGSQLPGYKIVIILDGDQNVRGIPSSDRLGAILFLTIPSLEPGKIQDVTVTHDLTAFPKNETAGKGTMLDLYLYLVHMTCKSAIGPDSEPLTYQKFGSGDATNLMPMPPSTANPDASKKFALAWRCTAPNGQTVIQGSYTQNSATLPVLN
jgi:hypothetical protein